MWWLGSGSPVALTKCESRRPILAAVLFISSAKASSVPLMPSATTTEASLPDWITMPRIRSSTLIWSLGLRNMVEPPLAAPPLSQALRLTVMVSVSLSLPSLSRSKST